LATPLSTRGKDVYFGIGLRRENLGDNNEERMKTLSYLPGLWADLDIQGPSHKRKELSPSQEEVLQFPDASFPLWWCTRNCVRRQHGSLPDGKPFGKEGKLPCKRKPVTRW